MFGLIFFVSILSVLLLISLSYIISEILNAKKYNLSIEPEGAFILISCLIAIIVLLYYWFSGATPRDYTSHKYLKYDKKYHLNQQVVLQHDRTLLLLENENKAIYTDYVGRIHLFLGLVSFNATNTPCVRTTIDKNNNYSTKIQDEILKVYYDNNLLRYLTFIFYGILSWSVIEYTCAYDVANEHVD